MREYGRWTSFVAVGDSFTEGLFDYTPTGQLRGWADRVAERLAAGTPGFRYANLAIRGRRLGAIVDEQVPVAKDMRPQLISFAGGVNDIMRPKVDFMLLARRFERGIRVCRATGADVLVFTIGDPSRRSWVMRKLPPRIHVLNGIVEHVAEKYGCLLVELRDARVFDHPGLWSEDRLHLNSEGHERIAGAVLQRLGLGDGSWAQPLPAAPSSPLIESLRSDLDWARTHFAPWVVRGVRGRSTGDGLPPKRPQLAPVFGYHVDGESLAS